MTLVSGLVAVSKLGVGSYRKILAGCSETDMPGLQQRMSSVTHFHTDHQWRMLLTILV
jgi:hypothetical protein